MIQKLCMIALGGALGALARYGVSGVFQERMTRGAIFPWGTLAVNLIGCFVIGLLWQWFDSVTANPHIKILLLTGFLGAFTTFSTYSLENVNLLLDGELKLAALNIAVSTLGGLALVYAGFVATRGLLKHFH